MNPHQRRSVRQEKSIARDTLGKRVAGSGSQEGNKGDVRAGIWLVEAKTTSKASYTVKMATWAKIQSEAILTRKEPALIIEMAGKKLAVIDYETWLGFRGE